MMELSEIQISKLGTSDEHILQYGLKRIHVSNIDMFYTCSYSMNIEKGYERYLGWSDRRVGKVSSVQLHKDNDSGGFFPTYATHQCKFVFKNSLHESWNKPIESIKFYIDVHISDDRRIVVFSTRNPDKEIMELDVACNSNGVYIRLLSKI